MSREQRVVLVTGASKGLGLAVARLLALRGFRLILTARGAEALAAAARELAVHTEVTALAGDVADPAHARRLVDEGVERFGRIDVLINNASGLGPTPMPLLADYPLDALEDLFRVNVVAPLHLIQRVLPHMRARGEGVIINVTSDAAVEAYPGWGGYGLTKAALEQLSRVLARELDGSDIRVYVVDPGDMDTELHRLAEPGADLSHLPGPEVPAPFFVRLIDREAASGRYRAQDAR